MATAQPTPGTTPGSDPTLGALVQDMTQQMSTLVRDEIRLAQAEMTQKGKRVGVGIGLFSAIDGLEEDLATAKGEHRP